MITKVDPGEAHALAPEIAEIYRWYVENTPISFELAPPTVEEMERRIEEIARRWTYYVYRDDLTGRVLGWACAHPWKEREAYNPTFEDTIYLHPDAQGGGVGSELMRLVLDDCRKMGVHSIVACITASNSRSIEFHRRFGFKEASYFKECGYKLGAYHDVIDMQLMLSENTHLHEDGSPTDPGRTHIHLHEDGSPTDPGRTHIHLHEDGSPTDPGRTQQD